ncbi:unnamed protein product [Bursaphelenchus okinawaensis]|uniref:Fucosyltransferase n=1 Tax=Bursaphelenchus okinawaensis TaxID=465554 RepID=A0A811KE76_9BILA|nr:unnamed protein product [Bursaphelenchus okinawaensis]CAG9103043.1 unnamed protein product [Bursaphelenchus okinawaensis]
MMGSDERLLEESTLSQKPSRLSLCMLRVYKLAKSLVIALLLVFLLWFLLINFGPRKRKLPLHDDVIQQQLMDIPRNTKDDYVHIYVADDIPVDYNVFKGCPVSNCVIYRNDSLLSQADAVVLTPKSKITTVRPPHQTWIMSLMESPLNTQDLEEFHGKINYIASYRYDSDFPTPYGYVKKIKQQLPTKRHINSKEKSGKILWLVSNCFTPSRRDVIADALSQYMTVDIKGKCGMGRVGTEEGFRLMREEYKFYLAFENSQCKDYVTEKLFNALRNDILPIVYGEKKSFYEKIAPPHSFIHVDDFDSVKKLAEYLIYLDKTPSAYAEYFKWKSNYYLSNSQFYCRLCSKLQEKTTKVYGSLNDWWSKKDCTQVSRPKI